MSETFKNKNLQAKKFACKYNNENFSDIYSADRNFTGKYYRRLDSWLEEQRREKLTNHIDKVKVLDAIILGWKEQGNQLYMVVSLKAEHTEYLVDDTNGATIRGSKRQKTIAIEEWTLCCQKDIKWNQITANNTGKITRTTCLSCGAPVNIDAKAICQLLHG